MLREAYLIINLDGEVIARFEAFSENEAGLKYERHMKERGEKCEPYQVMTRRDWVTWKTQPETFEWSIADEATD